jgi:hypothetical protein
MDVIQTRLPPKRSSAQPESGITAASASRYAVDTHCTLVIGVPKSRASVSSATFTAVVSRLDKMLPNTTVPATIQVARSTGSVAVGRGIVPPYTRSAGVLRL